MATTSDILHRALREIGVINAVDPASGEDAALALDIFNELLDEWNAEFTQAYASTITAYTLTPALNPHTIGPGGTWSVTQRPQAIEAAAIVSGSTRTPVTIRDLAWWMGQSNRTWSADRPSDLYYEPSFPLGKVWLSGLPDAANQIELQVRTLLAQVALFDTFTLPPGYRSALTLTLAERLTNAFKVELTRQLVVSAERARTVVRAANVQTARIATQDSGMPGSTRHSTYNYLTGRW